MGSAPAPTSPSHLVVCLASPQDARDLAPFLRHEDVAEIDAATGQSPLEALLYGLGASLECRTVHEIGRPIAMFGIVPRDGYGVPWLLGSDRIAIHREFARRSRSVFADIARPFQHLENRIDARQRAHIKWIQFLGFTLDDLRPWGRRGEPFWRMQWHRGASPERAPEGEICRQS